MSAITKVTMTRREKLTAFATWEGLKTFHFKKKTVKHYIRRNSDFLKDVTVTIRETLDDIRNDFIKMHPSTKLPKRVRIAELDSQGEETGEMHDGPWDWKKNGEQNYADAQEKYLDEDDDEETEVFKFPEADLSPCHLIQADPMTGKKERMEYEFSISDVEPIEYALELDGEEEEESKKKPAMRKKK